MSLQNLVALLVVFALDGSEARDLPLVLEKCKDPLYRAKHGCPNTKPMGTTGIVILSIIGVIFLSLVVYGFYRKCNKINKGEEELTRTTLNHQKIRETIKVTENRESLRDGEA